MDFLQLRTYRKALRNAKNIVNLTGINNRMSVCKLIKMMSVSNQWFINCF